MAEIPADVLFSDILSRLPAKTLLRFTSVSKEWQSLLKTPAFAKMHLHHVLTDDQQNHHKLLFFSKTPPLVFHTFDCEEPEAVSTAANRSRSVPFKVRPDERMSIVASFHGMVCVAITNPSNCVEYSDLILWNPLTGEHKTLCKPSFHRECYDTNDSPSGLYYSSSDDDYKLLRLTNHPNVYYIYSLKSDSWRKVELAESLSIRYWSSSGWYPIPRVLLDEKLYFLNRLDALRGPTFSIICFDIKTEKLREIRTPPFTNQWLDCLGFMVVGGCIHLCVAITNFTNMDQWMELWRLDGDGDKDWTKVISDLRIRRFSSSDQICHIMRDGNWLMNSAGFFYHLDMKKHTEKINSNLYAINSMKIRLGEKFVETIVSPNQYIRGQDRKSRNWMGLWRHVFWFISNNICPRRSVG